MATLDDKIRQIGKFLIQAERSSNEDERDTYFAKAQELASKYSVELEVARQKVAKNERRETPIQKTIDIGEPKKPLNAVFCELFLDIGRAQGLKFNIAHNSTYVIAFGLPSDIAITEAMYAHIAPQMIREATEFVKGGSWKGEETWCTGTHRMKPVTSRVARRCFYEEFIRRIGWRMREAKRIEEARLADLQVETAEGTMSTALVLKGKELEIVDFYNATSRARGSWKGNRGNTANSTVGRRSGQEAGQRARLGGSSSLPGGRKAIG